MSDFVPAGYQPFVLNSPFLRHIGPVFQCHSDNQHSLGLRVASHHCNALGFAHGGLLMTLADVALGNISALPGGTPPCVTVSMSCEFAAVAREGDWVEASVEVMKLGGALVFANCYLSVGEQRIARASGVFKLVRRP
jgi:acyl-coenzyme A thioesterase 13